MVKCPKCGKMNYDNSKFCSNCGSSLNKVLICLNCGKKFSNNEKFCTECGNELVSERQQNINNLYKQAKKYYDNRNYQKSIEYIDRITKLDTKNDNIWCLKANSYRRLKDDKKAIEFYNKTLELNPRNKDAIKSIGLSYQNVGEYNNALTYYNKYLKLYGYNKYINNKKSYCEKIIKNKANIEDEIEYQIETIEENEFLCFKSKTDKEVYFSKNNYYTAVYSINNEGKLNFSKYICNITDDEILESYCEHQLMENNYKNYTITNNYIYLIDEDGFEEQYSVENIINEIRNKIFNCSYDEGIYWI